MERIQIELTVTPTAESAFTFLHDRVQQAAYSLIAEADKQSIHLKIGRLLLANTSQATLEGQIFDVVNQLNQGVELITNEVERTRLAELNLTAGKKAKASTAYEAALKNFTIGIELLPENAWIADYQLTFALYIERSECEYLC